MILKLDSWTLVLATFDLLPITALLYVYKKTLYIALLIQQKKGTDDIASIIK